MLKAKLMKKIPTPGIEPEPRRWERRILTTRPRGSYILDLNRLYFSNRSLAHVWLKNAPTLQGYTSGEKAIVSRALHCAELYL